MFNQITRKTIVFLPALLGVLVLVSSLGICSTNALAIHRQYPDWVEIDRIVATVNANPVVLSEIMMEYEFGLLSTSDGEAKSIDDLIEPYINRLLILEEISEVGGFRVSKLQVQGAFRAYMTRFGGKKGFEKKAAEWGTDAAEIKRRLSRALTASLYTESRIQFFVNILPSDVEEAYAKEPERWGDGTLFALWNHIKETLQQEAFVRERDRWFASLRERYDLRMANGDNGGSR